MEKDFNQKVIEVCQRSRSIRAASLELGISRTTMRRLANRLNCNFTNQGLKGYCKEGLSIKELDLILSNKKSCQTYKLKRYLFKFGYKQDRCEVCGWSKKPEGREFTPCELHHIDGNPSNNLISNLQILCPNCHSLTETYRFRRGKKSGV